MIESLRTVADFEALAETADLECKLAEGRDGKGAIPKDFWPSYSAMANADGGWILLGVREQQGRFTPAGVANAEVLRRDLFNALNNREKVSINLLTEADVRICKVDDKQVLAVHIPEPAAGSDRFSSTASRWATPGAVCMTVIDDAMMKPSSACSPSRWRMNAMPVSCRISVWLIWI